MAFSVTSAAPGYLQRIHLVNTRTHQDVHIPIDAGERPFRHLVLLGKNGAGKTTALEGLAQWIRNPHAQTQIESYETGLSQFRESRKSYEKQMKAQPMLRALQDQLTQLKDTERQLEKALKDLNETYGVRCNKVHLSDGTAPVFVHVKAMAQFVGTPVSGPAAQNIESLKGDPNLDRVSFVQYLVNRRMEQALLREDGETEKADALAEWFDILERNLSELLGEDVSLLFERKPTFRFLLKRVKGPVSPFEALPSGWNAVMGVLSKLIIAYDANKKDPIVDKWPGILLIDEPELHLHPSLQWTVLPTVSKLFPHLQIVAATQSPIIAASLADAVVFDLSSERLLPSIYGSPPDSTLLRAFGSRLRPAELEKQLVRVEELFDKEKWDDAKVALMSFAEHVGEQDPDVIRLFNALELSKALDA